MADLTCFSSIQISSQEPYKNVQFPQIVGIIGGSLLLQLPAFQVLQQIQVSTSYGCVNLRCGKWKNLRIVFCHRHQSDPNTPYSQPRDIPFSAIVSAMQTLKCEVALGIYSVGSLKEDLPIGSLVLPHDYWNPFNIQTMTSDPTAHILPEIHNGVRELLKDILSTNKIEFKDQSVYVQSSGPRFETKSEVKFYSTVGDVVGMTGAHECELMTEKQIPFAMIAMVDNYANGIAGDLSITDLQDQNDNGKRVLEVVSLILNHFDSAVSGNPCNVDLIIFAKLIIPVEPIHAVYKKHAIVVHDEKIVAIVPWDEAFQKYNPKEVVDRKQHALIPGLVNAHTHASMTLLRGLADDKPLCEWLTEDIWPTEGKFVTPKFVKDGTRHAAAEMIRCGTTCYNDMYFFPEDYAPVAEEIGIRCLAGNIVLEFPNQYASNAQEFLEKGDAVRRKFSHLKLVRFAMAPHAPYTVSDESFQLIDARSKAENIPIHLHLHETHNETHDSEHLIENSMNRHQSSHAMRPIKNLHRMGLLSEKMVACHMTQLTDDEIEIVAQTRTNVVHCPTSNLKLASGISPIQKLIQAGANVAIGTDGASSNNSLDMMFEMKLAAILAKVACSDPTAVPAAMALRMATLNGAIALGMEKEIGSLVVGKSADIVAISLNEIEMIPMYDVISHIVYVAGRENVSDVWVAGKQLLKDRKLMTINEAQVRQEVSEWHDQIKIHHDSLLKAKGKLHPWMI